MIEQLQNEIIALKKINHPNVIKLYKVYEAPEQVFLFME
jgi:serine/threonine protein kinase